MPVDDYRKNIGFQGGWSLLVMTGMIGPGIIWIPGLFQSSGWLFPLLIFIVVATLTGLANLFLCEAMSYFPGNKNFERNVELTVLVHHFYGKHWYYLMHIIMYGSLQSFNIASIVSAIQSFDRFVLATWGKTCGFGLTRTEFYCVDALANPGSSSPFGNDAMLLTAGGMIFGGTIGPALFLNLDDNMIIQWLSLMFLFAVVIWWTAMACINGLTPSMMPMVSSTFFSSPTAVIGQVLFNYTLANTVPSWVNTKHKKVSIHKSIISAIVTATSIYLITGLFCGLSFQIESDVFAAMQLYFTEGPLASTLSFMTISFPIVAYLASIPVAIIVVKLNLITSGICSRDWATFFGTMLPILICIPLQTGPYVFMFTNWTGLIFQSLCNFIAPFLIYIFLEKRNLVMKQSVIDELENLDFDGAVRKKYTESDDDFDYVYHLPHADLSRVKPKGYEHYAKAKFLFNNEPTHGSSLAVPAIAIDDSQRRGSVESITHKRSSNSNATRIFKGMQDAEVKRKSRLTAYHNNISGMFIGANSSSNLSAKSTDADALFLQDGFGGGGVGEVAFGDRRARGRMSFVSPKEVQGVLSSSYMIFGGDSQIPKIEVPEDDAASGIRVIDPDPDHFKALPNWITRRVRGGSKTIAVAAFALTAALTLSVLLYDFVMLGMGVDTVD